MIKDEEIFFIDFQSARIGPLQYDLASLLIDPYVNLSDSLREDLLGYTMDRLKLESEQKTAFSSSYNHCMLTRNLQFLGAFSFLSQVKKKPYFKQFIPGSAHLLEQTAGTIQTDHIPRLRKLFKTITGVIDKWNQ